MVKYPSQYPNLARKKKVFLDAIKAIREQENHKVKEKGVSDCIFGEITNMSIKKKLQAIKITLTNESLNFLYFAIEMCEEKFPTYNSKNNNSNLIIEKYKKWANTPNGIIRSDFDISYDLALAELEAEGIIHKCYRYDADTFDEEWVMLESDFQCYLQNLTEDELKVLLKMDKSKAG